VIILEKTSPFNNASCANRYNIKLELSDPRTPLHNCKVEQKFQTFFGRITDILDNYPNFSIKFKIYTGDSEKQLGAIIMQNNRPIAFYSRKLNPA
jgi:hypothetical protein